MSANIQQELREILYKFEQNSNKAREATMTGIPLTTRLLKEKREALEAINSLVREVVGEMEPNPRKGQPWAMGFEFRNKQRQQFLNRWFGGSDEA